MCKTWGEERARHERLHKEALKIVKTDPWVSEAFLKESYPLVADVLCDIYNKTGIALQVEPQIPYHQEMPVKYHQDAVSLLRIAYENDGRFLDDYRDYSDC